MQQSEGQRRLATIVAVDLAGYSRQAEADEAGALKKVAELSQAVAVAARDHGGRVFNTAGDGFMLEFPTVTGALAAAEAVAGAGSARVGVHLGEVWVTPSGDLLGHGVNVAARLQALAQPGSVVVSDDVRRAVRGPLAQRLESQGRIRLDKMKEEADVFTLGPEGGRRRKTALAPRRRPAAPFAAAAAVLALAAAGCGAWLMARRPVATVAQAKIAVLPLDALSDAPEGKRFAEGVADQIATNLSDNNIPVVSRADAASLRTADREKKAAEFGAALVLDGVVQDFGDTVEARVHLDDPARHAILWSASVKGPHSQVGPMQAHIAKLVLNTVSCSTRALAPANGLTDPPLLTRYLHACDIFVNADFTPNRIYELLTALREVTQKAPNFAPAHSDLAKFSAYFIAMSPPADTPGLRAQAEAEAKAALALDPKSPDARLAQEFLLPPTAWGRREALLRKAVTDAPAWPHTNGFLGMLLTETGRVKEGLPFFQKAAAADLNIDWRPLTHLMEVCNRPDKSALDDLRQEFATEGDNATDRGFLMGALDCAGEYAEERELLRAGNAQGVANIVARNQFEARDAYLTAMLTHAPQDRAKARRLLLQAPGGSNSRTLYSISDLTALGFVDDALALAERFDPGGPNSGAQLTPLFTVVAAALHRDPRFMRVADRWKLVDYWRSSGAWPDFCAEPDLPYDCRAEAAKLHPDLAQVKNRSKEPSRDRG